MTSTGYSIPIRVAKDHPHRQEQIDYLVSKAKQQLEHRAKTEGQTIVNLIVSPMVDQSQIPGGDINLIYGEVRSVYETPVETGETPVSNQVD